MPGGSLIEIASSSTECLFLTGTPEITYFKTVYRRHTNFAIESLVVNFDDPVEFGGYNTAKVLQTGDLMHNVYLQVTLPQINLFRNTMPNTSQLQILYNTTVSNYTIVTNFMSVNRVAYVDAYNIFIAENNTENATIDMINAVNSAFENQTYSTSMQELLANYPNAPFTYNEISMQVIANGFDENSSKDALFKALSIGIDKSIKTQKYFYYQMYDANVALLDAQNKNIKFAWVDRIGHFIAEYIEVRIGGHIIDKHYGSWLNIWYELTANRSIQETYFKLIGNVSELTDFNRNVKPKYLLKIPLQFWFNRFSGLSIPLVALSYHVVSFGIHFREFSKLCYIESGTNIAYSLNPGGLTLAEVPNVITSINISANLLVDFYYLDSHERRRFAQSSHEYLIEQVQTLYIPNNTQPSSQILLTSFVNPSKMFAWICQKQKYTVNLDGTNKCRWDNYSISDENVGNIIESSWIDFNSYNRVMKLDGNYFNYVIPWQHFTSTPSDGINCYSFALFPEQFQVSGQCNTGKIPRMVLFVDLFQDLFVNGVATDPLNITVFSYNLNILRIVSGFGVLAFSYLP